MTNIEFEREKNVDDDDLYIYNKYVVTIKNV